MTTKFGGRSAAEATGVARQHTTIAKNRQSTFMVENARLLKQENGGQENGRMQHTTGNSSVRSSCPQFFCCMLQAMTLIPTIHVPVLPREVIEWLDPQPGQIIVDGTLGGGGHTRLLAERLGDSGGNETEGFVLALDRDA